MGYSIIFESGNIGGSTNTPLIQLHFFLKLPAHDCDRRSQQVAMFGLLLDHFIPFPCGNQTWQLKTLRFSTRATRWSSWILGDAGWPLCIRYPCEMQKWWQFSTQKNDFAGYFNVHEMSDWVKNLLTFLKASFRVSIWFHPCLGKAHWRNCFKLLPSFELV